MVEGYSRISVLAILKLLPIKHVLKRVMTKVNWRTVKFWEDWEVFVWKKLLNHSKVEVNVIWMT